jgi:sulfur carrier protein
MRTSGFAKCKSLRIRGSVRDGWHLARSITIVFMRLFINGEDKQFAEDLSLAQLIEQLGMKGDRVAVELNREIVPRSQWPDTHLKEEDKLEIVHFVGGGISGGEFL